MKHKNRLILVSLLFSIFLFLAFPQKAEAKYINHTTTPTELRGIWYIGRQKAIQFYKHSIHIGNDKLTPNRKGSNQLYVSRVKYQGNGGYTYIFQNPKYNLTTAESLPGGYWLTNIKIGGKKVMASYFHMGYFLIYTRNKTNNDYSFTDNKSDWDHAIGLKNYIGKYINKIQHTFQ